MNIRILFFLMLTALLHSPTLSAKKTRGSCGIDGSNYRSKIAKLFVVTYSQKDFFKPYMQENQFGGIIGFSSGLNSFKNAKLLRRELDSLRKNGVEFLTVDHEGGLVQRLKKYKNVTYMPSARVIGAYLDTLSEANALVQAERIGEIMGWDLAAAGFNWNFGPVFDVDHGLKGNPMTKYHRNFSSDKNRVAKYAAAISKGMRRHVIVTVKHFPGQGMAKLDSHYAGCKKSNSCPDFPAGDLEPFQKAISQGVADSVMVGHVEFANLDNKLATYSKKVIQQILRKRLAYEGLVVSDDFTMGALGHAMGVSSKSFRSGDRVDAIKKAVETALKAGVQLFVFSEYVNGRREAQVVDHICSRISKDSEIRNAVDLAWEKLSAVRQRISKLPAVEFDAKKHKKNQLYIKSILQTVLKTKGRPQVAEWDSKALKNYSL